MTTKRQAIRRLRDFGFEFDESVTGKIGHTWSATIDAIGRTSISNDCRGIVVMNYTATASEFWDECIEEARQNAIFLNPCPHPPGECDFHDHTEDDAG